MTLKYLILLFSIILSFTLAKATVLGQKYADKNYYLIDSLDLSLLSEENIAVVENGLAAFHQSKNDTTKIKGITDIIDECWDNTVWIKYNRWVYRFANNQLKNNTNLDPATKYFYQSTVANCLNDYGFYYEEIGDIYNSISFYKKSISYKESINDLFGLALTHNNIGLVYSDIGKYNEALDYYYKSLKISEKNNFITYQANSYNNIGTLYNDLGDQDKAMEFFIKSLAIKVEIDDKLGCSTGLNNIGSILFFKGAYDSSIYYFKKGLQFSYEVNDNSGIAITLSNIGSVFKEKEEYDSAEVYYGKSLKVAQTLNNLISKSSVYLQLSDLYFRKKEYSKALKYSKEAFELSMILLSPEKISLAAEMLKKLALVTNDYKTAYFYLDIENSWKDSIKIDENYKMAHLQQELYEYDKKFVEDSIMFAKKQELATYENQKRQAEIKSQKYLQRALIFVLALTALFCLFIYSRFRLSKKQNKIIELQKREVENQRNITEEKHKEITDSINYAERIQRSFLASKEVLDTHLLDYFILFEPKAIVSGDFYWAAEKEVNGQKLFYFATADSTGHGVPGAIMSILNSSSLEKALETCSAPNEILNKTREIIIDRLKKDGSIEGGKDGMDCTLLVFNENKTKIQFAAANNPVWIVRNGTVIEFKGDRMPVGKDHLDSNSFTLFEFELEKNDVIYTLTDGYQDQFGGDKGKKFMVKSLKNLIVENAHLSLAKQNENLRNSFIEWKGNLEQIDDVCIIGIRI